MLISVLITYIISVTTFLILPGPVNLFVANSALRYGFKGTLWAIIGTNLASLVLIIVAGVFLVGAQSVSTLVLDTITLLGGFFLLYYGFMQIRDGLKTHTLTTNTLVAESEKVGGFNQEKHLIETDGKTDSQIGEKQLFSPLKLAISGFAIGISNPKDVIFFMAFFPPFLMQLGLPLPMSLLILIIVWCVLDYTLLFLYGFLTKHFIKGIFERVFLLFCGILFVGIGTYAVYWAILDIMYTI